MITLYFLLAIACVPVNFVTAIKIYNETCMHSDDCFDNRMVCIADEENILRCLCNKYHRWSESESGCVQIYSIAYIMNKTVSVRDNLKKLRKVQEAMFRGPVYSVFFMIFIILLCIISVIVFCYRVRRKDHRLKILIDDLNDRNAKEERLRRSMFRPIQSTSQC